MAHGDLPLVAQRQRTAEGIEYERFLESVKAQLKGMTSEEQLKAARANQDFLRGVLDPHSVYRESYKQELERDVAGAREKAVTPSAVHVDTVLATMSVMYANDDYVGERLLPVVTVIKRSGKYAVYTKRDRFAYPDDLIGYRGESNEVDESRSFSSYALEDRGLSGYLDLETIQNQDRPLNEMVDVNDSVNEGVAFNRELRHITILTTSGNYSGNTAAASTQWTAANSGGSVIADLLSATGALWRGPNRTRLYGFCSLDTWNTGMANNAALIALHNNVKQGLTTTQMVAQYFGLDDILVSRARKDTANEGQTASYSRILSAKHFGVVSVSTSPSTRSLHFGSTFREQGDPFTTQWFDPKLGKRGGYRNRVAVSEDIKVVAGDAGFLVTSVLP
ncbi:MAG: hypothetical protein ACWGPR_08580 [Candidatus Deferrimicrobiaceae bacterium]